VVQCLVPLLVHFVVCVHVVILSVFDSAVTVDALDSGVCRCVSLAGAAYCACLTLLVRTVILSKLDAVAQSTLLSPVI
jgi:hypothetical protein